MQTVSRHVPLLGWTLVFASCIAVWALVQQAHGHLSPVLSWHPRNATAHLPAGRVRGDPPNPGLARRGGGRVYSQAGLLWVHEIGHVAFAVASSYFAALGAQLCWCLRIQTGQTHLASHTPRPLPQHRSALSGPHPL